MPTTALDREPAVALARALTPARLAPYLGQAGPSLPAALRLYRRNATAAAALHEDLGAAEVVLRNALTARLADDHRAGGWTGGWWTDPEWRLTPHGRADAAAAASAALRTGRSGPDGVAASLGFGFWRALLAPDADPGLWPVLRPAFPHLTGGREDVHRPVALLSRVRNLVAHHEPVGEADLRDAHDAAVVVVGYVCPVTASWVAATSRVPALLATARAARGPVAA